LTRDDSHLRYWVSIDEPPRVVSKMEDSDRIADTSACPDCTAVLLIAHGSRQQSANDDLHALAARLAAQGLYPIVEACFLELSEPDIPTGGHQCVSRGATCVLLIPYFLSAGVHLGRDLTAARDELSRLYPSVDFRLGAPLGPHPLLDDLVAERIRELDPRDPSNAVTFRALTSIDTNLAKQ
jgi:sirohydrochlorin ferrochelatase